MKRFKILSACALFAAVFLATGCDENQKQKFLSILQGAATVTQAMSGLPLPPGMEVTEFGQQYLYWSKYAAGVSKGISEAAKTVANPTSSAAPSPSTGQQ